MKLNNDVQKNHKESFQYFRVESELNNNDNDS